MCGPNRCNTLYDKAITPQGKLNLSSAERFDFIIRRSFAERSWALPAIVRAVKCDCSQTKIIFYHATPLT
jgi:hypothetical protein